jgi:hypothetical protein
MIGQFLPERPADEVVVVDDKNLFLRHEFTISNIYAAL